MEKFCDFFYYKTFLPNYNLDLRSYGQLFSLFFLIWTSAVYNFKCNAIRKYSSRVLFIFQIENCMVLFTNKQTDKYGDKLKY